MANDDLTIRVLTEIRDQVAQTNVRLDRVREDLSDKIDGVSARLDGVAARVDGLSQRVSEGEIRTSTVMYEMVATNREIAALLRGRLDVRDRVERCERDIDEIKKRLDG